MQRRMGQGPANKKLGRAGQRRPGQGLGPQRTPGSGLGQSNQAKPAPRLGQRLGRQGQRPRSGQGGGRLTQRPQS